MKMLSCADLGENSCHYVSRGNTKEEVADNMMEHAKTAHADKMKEMMADKSEMGIKQMMMGKVHEG
ncbi:MAG: DUF1059 domain-containing protein [Patescibacteria group bacterium]|jgi:predicted small metal-binding protein